jgi:hypothetical protein
LESEGIALPAGPRASHKTGGGPEMKGIDKSIATIIFFRYVGGKKLNPKPGG